MKKIIFSFVLSFITIASIAQQVSSTPPPYAQRKFFDSAEFVVPLLIKQALKASPEMKRGNVATQVADIDLKQAKNEILKQFYVNGNYNYGSTPNYLTGVQQSSFNAFNQSARALYLVGINLNISLEQIFGGIHQRVQKQELVVQQAKAERQESENAVRIKIITYYNALVLSKKLFEHSEDALQSASVNKELIDKQFKNSEVKVTEKMSSDDLYSRAVIDQETAKSNYQLNVLLLEESIGMKLNQFIYDYVK